MTRRLHITLIGLFVGFFLTFQIASTAHAARYDDGPHQHDEAVCLLGTVTAEDQAVVPVVMTGEYDTVVVRPVYETVFASARYVTPQGRAPPPRSPPLAIL